MNRIGQIIGVTAQSVMRWMKAFAAEYRHSIDQELEKPHIRETEVNEVCYYIKKQHKVWIWKIYDRALK